MLLDQLVEDVAEVLNFLKCFLILNVTADGKSRIGHELLQLLLKYVLVLHLLLCLICVIELLYGGVLCRYSSHIGIKSSLGLLLRSKFELIHLCHVGGSFRVSIDSLSLHLGVILVDLLKEIILD